MTNERETERRRLMTTKREVDAFIKDNYLINPIALAKDIYDFIWKSGRKKGNTSIRFEFHELDEITKREMVNTASELMKKYYIVAKDRL